jgi:hypothetical protein
MSVQDLGAIGELLAAIATLATLVYLARQIRQNTKAIKGSTLNAITQHKQFEIRWSSEIGAVYRKSIESPESLDETEEFVMTDWLLSSFVARENEYYQYCQGLLDEDNWRSSEKAIRMILGTEFALNWWKEFSSISFGDSFIDYVNKNLLDNRTDYRSVLAKIRLGAPDDA